MSSPAERGETAPPPSFASNLVRTLPFMFLCGIVGPIFLVLYIGIEPKDGIGWMLWTGLAVTLLDLALGIGLALGRTNAQRLSYRLQRTGRRAVAEVLTVEQTGVRVNDEPLLDLRVRIEGEDVAAFEAEKRFVISEVRLPLLYTGPLPVVVDPETREWEFDWDEARPASIAPAVASSGPRSRADRLAELDDLFRRDLLTREEYDAARARILGEL